MQCTSMGLHYGGAGSVPYRYNTRLEGVAISDPYALDLTLINVK